MNNVKTTILKIEGGIIRMSRAEYFMIVATMPFPVGVGIMILGSELRIFGILMVALAMLSWTMALWALRLENKQEAKEKQAFYELLWDIRDELAGIRQDRNDRHNKPN